MFKWTYGLLSGEADNRAQAVLAIASEIAGEQDMYADQALEKAHSALDRKEATITEVDDQE